MENISEQKRNLRFLFLIIILLTIPCYCLGFVVMQLSNRVKDIEPLPTEFTVPTTEIPTDTVTASMTPEQQATPTTETQTATITLTPTVTRTPFLTPTATQTYTPTMTHTPTVTQTATATQTETITPTATATEKLFEFSTPTEEN